MSSNNNRRKRMEFLALLDAEIFRGKKLHITVQNPAHRESGFTSLMLNGAAMPDNYIPADKLAAENEIVLTM